MEAIYTRFAPHKLCKVGGLLTRYAGDEDKLLRIVRRKYVGAGQEREQHPAGEDVKSTSSVAPCGGGEHDGGQHKGDEHHQPGTETAPSHGGDTTSDCGEHGGGGPIYQSIIKPTASTPTEEQGQIPAWNEEPLDDGDEGGDQDKGKDKKASRKAWPPPGSNNDGGKLDPQGDGSGREADGQSATSSSVPASSSSSSWTAEQQQQHDLEALSREMEILEGWERLHPPTDAAAVAQVGRSKASPSMTKRAGLKIDVVGGRQGQHGHGNREDGIRAGVGGGGGGGEGGGGGGHEDGDEDGENGGGGGGKAAKGGRRKRRPAAAVELMIQRAFEDDRKMTLRLRCPLQQQRGSAMDPQTQPTTKLPQVGGARSSAAAVSTTAPNQHNVNHSPPPAAVGPEQREKAQRLMKGFSSTRRRSASAPSGPSGGTSPQEDRSTLPVSLRIAVVRAKEWRRRRDEGNARRNVGSVAVKMHTFDFGEVP